MHIALHTPFPPDLPCAEHELACRIGLAITRLGWTSHLCRTAAEIEAAAPDLVLALHTDAPKLTRFPTLGCLWNPPAFFENEPARLRKILSYDGFLTAGPNMRDWVEAMLFPTTRSAQATPFFPSCHTDLHAPHIRLDSRAFYVGSNWDGTRFADLFAHLEALDLLNVWGPRDRWQHCAAAYRGELPFDGKTLLDRACDSGIGLCLHLPAHIDAGIPNMRVFELCAAGCLIISDRHPFVVEHFGEDVLYVDMTGTAKEVADTVARHIAWARTHRKEAMAMALRCQDRFVKSFTLERLLEALPDLLSRVRMSCGFDCDPNGGRSAEGVDYIVRCGGRPLSYLRRCLSSLAAQTHDDMGVVLVRHTGTPDPSGLLAEFSDRFARIRCVNAFGAKRSTALWTGLHHLQAPWFGILDDDDTLHPNHVSSLLHAAEVAEADLVYAGSVKVVEDGPEDEGDRRHALAYFEPYDRCELLNGQNYITSNSYIARSGLLNDRLLRDPRLDSMEDLYLLRQLALQGTVVPSWLVTSAFHWRTDGTDNTVFARTQATLSAQRLARLERLDPILAVTRTQAAGRPVVDSGRLAIWNDLDHERVSALPAIQGWEDVRGLAPHRPILIYGASKGGRILLLELSKRDDLTIHGFLDSKREGEAWGLPLRRLDDVGEDELREATIVIASQFVSEIARALDARGSFTVYNGYPLIFRHLA